MKIESLFFCIATSILLFCKPKGEVTIDCLEPKAMQVAGMQEQILYTDSNQYFFSYSFIKCRESDCYYMGCNDGDASVYVYSLSKGKLYNTIKFPEGDLPESFNINGLFVQNLDSIFVYDETRMLLKIINIDGFPAQAYDLKKAFVELNRTHPDYAVDLLNNEFLYAGGDVIFRVVCESVWSDTEAVAKQKSYLIRYNLKLDQFVLLEPFYPDFLNNSINPLLHRFNVAGPNYRSNFYLNFIGSPIIYEMNKHGQVIKEICRSSRFLNTLKYKRLPINNFADERKFFLEEGYYVKILMDDSGYLKCCILKHPLREYRINQSTDASFSPWSCLYFENDLPIGELNFKGGIYNFYESHFQSDNRLWVRLIQQTLLNHYEDEIHWKIISLP